MGDLKAATKQHVVKTAARSMLGAGVLGKALSKTFEEKFGEKEQTVQDDPRVVQALEEQQQIHKENNSILVRMERIVTNISDNVYNIAGVLNDQVVSMQEAKRLRDEQHSRDMAAQEEAAAETQKQLNPTLSATSPPQTKDGEKKGLLSSILGEVGSTKKMLGKFLKKFAVVAVGLGTLLGAGALFGKTFDEKDGEQTTEEPSSIDPAALARAMAPSEADQTPPAPTPVPPDSESPSSFMTNAMTRLGGEQGSKDAPFMGSLMKAGESGDMGGFIEAAKAHAAANPPPPPPTPVAPPPAPAASSPAPSTSAAAPASPEDNIKRLEGNIENNNKRLADREKRAKMRADDWKKRYADDPARLNELLEKDKIDMDNYRGMVEGSNKEAQQQIDALKSASSTSPGASGGSSAAAAPPSSAGATPVQSSPSTGKDIGTQSTDVAAAAALPPPSQDQVVDTTPKQASEPIGPGGVDMPSPIASRGSLDNNTTFEASN